jgi:hypothetical protein
MDFKYKSRMGKTWNTEGLMSYLKRNYPGALTLAEAVSQEIALRNGQEPKPHQDQASLICPETVTQNKPKEF